MAMAMANVNLNESRGPDMIGAIVSTYCVAIAVVALRIFARRVGKVRLWIDDYLILVGMVRDLPLRQDYCTNTKSELRHSIQWW